MGVRNDKLAFNSFQRPLVIQKCLPASIPFTLFARLQHPSPKGINFHNIITVTPPAPQEISVATTADPRAFPSPASLTDP